MTRKSHINGLRRRLSVKDVTQANLMCGHLGFFFMRLSHMEQYLIQVSFKMKLLLCINDKNIYSSHFYLKPYNILIFFFYIGQLSLVLSFVGVRNCDVYDLVTRENFRMPSPSNCPEVIYNIMRSCWRAEPEDRPTFKILRHELDKYQGN